MKKIICTLLLIQSGFMMAQTTETLVTPNGKRVTINTNPLISANNGLTATSGNVQLGGSLVQPSVLTTTSAFTLALKGLQTGAATDNIMVTDANGVIKTISASTIASTVPSTEPWYVRSTTTQATSNTQDIYQNGSVGIKTPNPGAVLDVNGNAMVQKELYINAANNGDGTQKTGLVFGGTGSGESITSSRSGSINNSGLDFWTGLNRRMSITGGGNVGIGTATPGTKLEVNNGSANGAIKIVDGTQGTGKVLTSDASGVGTWVDSSLKIVDGVTPTVSKNFTGNGGADYVNAYIDLPAGSWALYVGLLINPKIGDFWSATNTTYAGRFTISTSTTGVETNGISFKGSSQVLNTAAVGTIALKYPLFAAGIIRVVTTAASTRLYLWNIASSGGVQGGGEQIASIGNNAENYLYAIRTQ